MDSQLTGILPGHFQRLRAKVRGNHAPAGPFPGQCQGDGPTARAQIRHQGLVPGNHCQRRFHQKFRFRTRNQHGGGYFQLMLPEIPASRQVGHGLAGGAALDQPVIIFQVRLLQPVLRPGIKKGARPAQHMREQHFRIQPGGSPGAQ